ncbi:sensor histidine kinase [Paenibacillus psychroresistens]|uniref:Sensor histidine kinase n=2 Tax=Paenibacillus psychroresistens TaxID=1778678 RepID=A0A6B8RXR5_9BACL|nr:sensor histidine kinase [Paenibacillus psychroresistens]
MRKTNDIKLRHKLVLSIVFVMMIPVMMVGIFLTVELRQMALNDATKQTLNNVERVQKQTLEIINVALDISTRLLFDNRLKALANTSHETVYDVVKAYQEYPDIRDNIRLNKQISNIRLYMDNPTLINNWEFFQIDKKTEEAPWFKSAVDGKGMINWYYIEDERTQHKELSLIRKIDFLEYHTFGILVINVSGSYLNSSLSLEPFETMIVDDNNNIVSANRGSLIGKTLEDLNFDSSVSVMEKGTYESVVDGERSRIVIDKLQPDSSLSGLRIVSVFSIASIVKDANRINQAALTVIIISLLVAIVLIYVVSMLLSNRLLRLSKHISKLAVGNLNAVLEIDGKDEIAQISRQFNSMIGNIKELMNEVQATQIQKNQLEIKQNEIKFKMLASQINPHFLFNALESIRMKAHLKGDNEISIVVKNLGRLMRSSLNVGSKKIPLQNELEMVRYYLEIQQFRYGDRVSFNLSIDPRSQQVEIPPLIIQPLVENAVIHGLENRMEHGIVSIKAYIVGEELRIEVLDNGQGMDQRKVNELVGLLNSTEDDHNHIGMRNVHHRLQLSYGIQYGLNIHSQPNKGTKIEFCIPIGGSLLV